MAHATPLVRDAALWVHDDLGQGKTIPLESVAWWRWLEEGEQRTFRFEHSLGTFTARREQKRSGYYWYAYRKYQGRLYKTYLGKAEELRLDCLERAAYTLSELAGHIPATTNAAEKTVRRQGAMDAIETSAPAEPQKLLATKLYQPPTRAGIVTRPYLLRRLDMCLECRLMLVVAPAGFGKTTLLSDWCASRADILHAWLSLDKGDNDPARFWGYVLASLQRIFPSLFAGSFAEPRQGSLDGMLTELVNALAYLEQDIVLILDDYHLITMPGVHEDMAFLLEHSPPRLHLALASRVEPPLPLARLRARGQLGEVHATDLRFTTDEAARFLQQVMKLDVSRADVELLEARTEGWIAAIQLVALSAQAERTANLVALMSPAGQHRYIIDYLTEEVLLSQPEDARSFLLQTSLLERFNAEVCDAVTGRSESSDVLKRFEQANLFLVALDAEGEWWRYHHLFAEFLRHSLRRMHPDWITPLYERASAWFESRHLMNEAIHYAFASGNLVLTARLIQACALGTMARGEITTLLGWLETFPEAEMRRYPFLHAAFAGTLTGVGQLERAGKQLQLAQAAIEDLKASGERREEWRELDGLYLVCAGSLASFRGMLPVLSISLSKRWLFSPLTPIYVASLLPAWGMPICLTAIISKPMRNLKMLCV
ncbi:hypothetical protein [Ktedonospora formicarum]|uniref:MalT-like winged helix domain-containing protein n=1 Tax=Ktedonospora formicarum TaxID=2778364 RepID=A0A8J3MSJ4_9CHLR|nr:hypothetical protein [Ktedonospora formicarum]GHO44936.1 hypothetical protein KSX_30990 [Ktedonospora formicarum]